MDEEELERIRQKKLEEMKEKQQEADEAEASEAEARKKAVLRKVMTPEARQRLNNIRMARPEFADSVEQQLVMLASSGRIRGKIDDEQLKEMLKKAQSGSGEIRIRRK